MATSEADLPFRVEYAKTGRAGCKMCKTPIEKDSVRLAAMVQSSFHDGKMPNWFHEECFFKKQRPRTEGDVANFENMRYSDQQRIKAKIAEVGSTVVPASGKGKKRQKADAATTAATKDYGIEYAKSGRAACCGCQLKISKDEIRVKKVVYDTEVGMKFGGQPLWHHLECFAQIRNDLGWLETGVKLPGYSLLKAEDQKKAKALLPPLKSEDVPDAKKPKIDVKEEAEDKELEAKIAKQNELLFKYRDNIQKNMSKAHMIEILEDNDQDVPEGDTLKLLDLVSDVVTFGALKRCKKCKKGQLMFSKSGYICTGDLTEWVKCTNFEKEPSRVSCKIDGELKSTYSFLKKYKCKVEARAIKYVPSSVQTSAVSVKKEDELAGPKVKREKPPLYQLEFAIVGLKSSEEKIKKLVHKLGGRIVTKIHASLAGVFSTEEQIEKMSSKMENIKGFGIQVIPEDFLDAVQEDPTGAISYITSKSICDWGTDPNTRIPQEDTTKSKSKSIYTKSVPKSMKLQLKGGVAVDPDSGLADVAHVYIQGNVKWNVVLGRTDLQSNKNSYYKLQLLERDGGNGYWLFRSWGRIGTTIGSTKVQDYSNLLKAQDTFKEIYAERTGNNWEERDNFVKVPGKMYPIDVDYGADEEKVADFASSKIKSCLHDRVQELIKLIFDVNMMKKVMLEFDLDMEKMPLGKLSQKQLQSAYKVLTEVSDLIKNGGSDVQFIDCTNRFYTLIPHSFGVNNPPILNTTEQVTHHSEMLDSLMEIECAYSLLQNTDKDVKEETNPLDQHYDQLKTDLIPLEKLSEEFKLMSQYVHNTHAETHRMYELEIVDIFKVSRKGEARRYKPFKKLHNRKLLWHGSRLTNYAGILSHGLKIAPPEAPVTGYMFGKGIYFADMVSKSANYCFTSKENNTGLLLLSEVALGDMLECSQAKYVTKLPNNKHSTMGIGQTCPNPKESHFREDGVEIPLGKPVSSKASSSLLYNEFIVYDVAQANIQYMFRVNFKYKY